MNTFYEFSDIEDYLNGQMSPADRSAFETAMAADPELTLQVEALRSEPQLLRLLQKEMLRKRLANWQLEEKRKNNRTAPSAPYARWLVVAVVMVIVSALLYWRYGPASQGSRSQAPVAEKAPAEVDSMPLVYPQTPTAIQPPREAEHPKGPARRMQANQLRIQFIVDSLGLVAKPTRSFIAGRSPADSLFNLAWEKFEHNDPATLRLLDQLDTANLDVLRMRAYLYYARGNNAAAAKLYARVKADSNVLYHISAERAEIACYLLMLPERYPDLDHLLHNLLRAPEVSESRKALARWLLDEITWAKH